MGNEVGGWHERTVNDVVEALSDMVTYNTIGESVPDLDMQNPVVYIIAHMERQMQSPNSPAFSENMNNEVT